MMAQEQYFRSSHIIEISRPVNTNIFQRLTTLLTANRTSSWNVSRDRGNVCMIRHVSLLATLVLSLGMSAEAETLTILHTNDLHARIEPINQYNQTCTAEEDSNGKCFGGYARLATALQGERVNSENSILVDGGDQFQGSLFFTHYQGQALAEMMNMLGYDGMAVGNHEFNLGPEALHNFIKQAEFPVLLSNADISDEPLLKNILMSSAVIEKGNFKYGLIGLAPVNTAELSSPGPSIRFTDPGMALDRQIAKLANQGIDRIVLLSHSGYEIDKHLAATVEGIDVIVGGHSHTLLSNQDSEQSEGPYPTLVESPNGSTVAIVQAQAYGKYLGRLDVSFDDRGRIALATGNPIILDNKFLENQEIKKRISELSEPLNELRNRIIGEAGSPIDGSRKNCRIRECEIGNLVADAMLSHAKSHGFDIAITNAGGLRSSIDQGAITMGEVLTVLPFQNQLSSFELTGADLLVSLKSAVSKVGQGGGQFPQVSGLRFRYSLSPGANAKQVYDVQVNLENEWLPLDPDQVYGIVSNDFLRGGGDGYSVFAQNALNAYDYGPEITDIVVEYLQTMNPYQPILDGRIIDE